MKVGYCEKMGEGREEWEVWRKGERERRKRGREMWRRVVWEVTATKITEAKVFITEVSCNTHSNRV